MQPTGTLSLLATIFLEFLNHDLNQLFLVLHGLILLPNIPQESFPPFKGQLFYKKSALPS